MISADPGPGGREPADERAQRRHRQLRRANRENAVIAQILTALRLRADSADGEFGLLTLLGREAVATPSPVCPRRPQAHQVGSADAPPGVAHAATAPVADGQCR